MTLGTAAAPLTVTWIYADDNPGSPASARVLAPPELSTATPAASPCPTMHLRGALHYRPLIKVPWVLEVEDNCLFVLCCAGVAFSGHVAVIALFLQRSK